MSTIVPIGPKRRFYLSRVELCDPVTFQPAMVLKPFCKAHRQWPCKECGTAHHRGCECSFCAPMQVIEVNMPFERLPQHAWDPGHGPVPPIPKECAHGVSTKFNCPQCNTPSATAGDANG